MRAAVLALAALLTIGCGDDEAPASAPHRGPFGAPAVSVADLPPTSVASGRSHREHDTLDHEPLHVTPPPTGGTSTTTGTTAATAAEPEGRNYVAELATAVGSPAACIDTAIARTMHGRLSIQITATVMASGGVTRATASGGSLPESVVTCMQARALAARIAGPVEDAPRTISTTLTFDVATTDDTVTQVTPDWHQPGAVAEPGHVLPAVGAEGRPEGAVAPDSTLPARAPAGRQEGTLAPDVVTPARGGGGTIWPSNP
jgi:hypothetical protein